MGRRRGRRGKAPKPTATVGLALIVYNEEDNLPRLLDSVTGAFDQVVLVDSDSTDETVTIFREWCERTRQRHVIDNFVWTDDFSAKRSHAFGLLTTDWTCWADADDTIVNASAIRRLARQAPPDLAGFLADYDYIVEDGEPVLTFPRERLIRRGAGTWVGRTHDAQVVNGPVTHTKAIRWVHHSEDAYERSTERDRRILERWHREEPDNSFVTAALGAYRVSPEMFDFSMAMALHLEREAAALDGECWHPSNW